MSNPFLTPICRKSDKSNHLTYELQHRTHCAIHYPVETENGVSIIVYGHDRGLTCLWRASRPTESQRAQSRARISKYDDEDVSMTDETDQNNENKEQDSAVETKDFDDVLPYEPIASSLDLDLEVGVLQISACHLPKGSAKHYNDSIPPILTTHIVVAINCTDSTTRLLAVPLDFSKTRRVALKRSEYEEGIQQLILSKPARPNPCPPRCVALAWTSAAEFDQDSEMRDHNTAKTHRKSRNTEDWTLLVTSHDPEPLPVLYIWHVSFIGKSHHSFHLQETSSIPRTLSLPSICSSIVFNTTSHPSAGHRRLLLVDITAKIRVLELARDGKGHRWLTSLAPPIEESAIKSPFGVHKANRILDAKWALAGKAIVVLLNDGRWGIWDVEGVKPAVTNDNVRISTSAGGVRGGGINPFSLHGYVGVARTSHSTTRNSDLRRPSKSKSTSTLAPMTPNTRSKKQEQLFTAPVTTSPSSITKNSSFVQGGIALTPVPHPSSKGIDDSLLLWYDMAFYRIPSLMSYWQTATTIDERHGGSSPNSTISGPRIKGTLRLDTGGERITSVIQFTSAADAFDIHHQERLQPNVLISAEHRLVMLCPVKESRQQKQTQSTLRRSDVDPKRSRLDQDLLSKGELGLEGVDRLLDGLANGESRPGLFGQNVIKRRVEFATNH